MSRWKEEYIRCRIRLVSFKEKTFTLFQGWGARAGRSRPLFSGELEPEGGASMKKNGRLRLLRKKKNL